MVVKKLISSGLIYFYLTQNISALATIYTIIWVVSVAAFVRKLLRRLQTEGCQTQ